MIGFKRSLRHIQAFKQHSTFYYKDTVKTVRHSALKVDIDSCNIAFGQEFTSHMMEVDFSNESGWGIPLIHPFRHFMIHPANSSIHYALSCFDGKELELI